MKLPRVDMKRRPNGTWRIEIDGRAIPNVTSMSYSKDAGSFPVVTIHLVAELYIENELAPAVDNMAPWAERTGE